MRCAALTLTAALAGSGLGCSSEPTTPELPGGTLLAADTARLAPLVRALQAWTETRVSDRATAFVNATGACTGKGFVQWQEAPDGGDATETSGCEPPPGWEPLVADLATHAAAFALPGDGPERWRGTVDAQADGGFELSAAGAAPEPGTALDLLVPAATGPEELGLDPNGALILIAIRQAHVPDIRSMVGSESQGADLFNLQSSLFADTLLRGTWSLAIYPGDAGLPLIAAAIGVRSESIAVKATEEFVAQLEQRWTFASQPWNPSGEGPGACVTTLRLLPQLAPCWTVSQGHLVVGWNEASVRRALVARVPSAPQAHSFASVDLEALVAADTAIDALFNPTTSHPALPYPFRRLELEAWQTEGTLHLQARGQSRTP